jgi:hypothetical protein
MAVGAFMEAVEHLGVTIVLRVDGARERPRGTPRLWTVVLEGPQFGEAGAVRGDLADLDSCLGFVREQVSELGKLEFAHLADGDVDAVSFEEILVELAAGGVGFSVQRNHLASGYFTTPWRVIVSGTALAESVVIENGRTFRESVGLGLRWLRPRLDDAEWLDLYL